MQSRLHDKMSARRGLAALAVLGVLTGAGSARAAELLVFERPGCVWCLRFDQEIAPVYPKTEEGRLAPLRRLDIDGSEPSRVALAAPVHYAPTFVLVEAGREVGRIPGYAGEEAFWGLLADLTKKLSRKP
jgi:thioredoxin-related protein